MTLSKIRPFLVAALVCGGLVSAAAAADHYCLKAGATGAGTGTSWEDAFTDPATAIAKAGEDKIPLYVAEGVYVVSATIALPDGVAVYGGFAGVSDDETLDGRDPDLHQSIFSGDQDGNNVWSHAVPSETEAKVTVTPTAEPILKNSRVNPPPAYTGDYDAYFAQPKGTDTPRCFSVAANCGVTIDGLTIVGFGANLNTADGAVLQATTGTYGNEKVIAITNCRVYGVVPYGGGIATGQGTVLQISDCAFRFIGATAYTNPRGLVFMSYSKGFCRNCRVESIVRTASGNSASVFLMPLGYSTRTKGIDITGCTIARSLSCTGANDLYGGTANIVGYGQDHVVMCSFCDNVISNCYTGSSGSAKGSMPLICPCSGLGSNNGGTFSGLRIERNLSVVTLSDDRCHVMFGTSGQFGNVAYWGLANSVFRDNRIHAYRPFSDSFTRGAIGIVGNNTPTAMSLVNCVFDGNEVTVDAEKFADADLTLSRGAIVHRADGENASGIGLANCTFTGPLTEGVADVAQSGSGTHDQPLNLVNCIFDCTDAATASPFSWTAPALVHAYGCAVKDVSQMGDDNAANPVPLDALYRPAARVPGLDETATVVTNSAVVNGGGTLGNYRPTTFAFIPRGTSAAQALCPLLSAGTNDKGAIGDLYGDSRADGNVRGAVQTLSPAAVSGHTLMIVPQPFAWADEAEYAGSAACYRVADDGEPVTVRAVPAEGRYFAEWRDADGNLFSQDNPVTVPALTDDLVLVAKFSDVSLHKHSWTVTQPDDATVSATCANADGECKTPTLALKLTATSRDFNQQPLTAALEGLEAFGEALRVEAGEIVYRKGDETLAGAPSDVGSYTASVAVTIGETAYSLVCAFTIAPHEHNWSFAASYAEARLTATCDGEGCPDSPVALALVGEDWKKVDGTPLVVALEGGTRFAELTGANVGDVVYARGDEDLAGAPSEPGNYTARVTVTVGGETYTLYKPFEILLHTHTWSYSVDGGVMTATCANEDGACDLGTVRLSLSGAAVRERDGEPLAAELEGLLAFQEATGAEVGAIAYRLDEDDVTEPTEPGTYAARVVVTVGGRDYELKRDYTILPPMTYVCLKPGATGAGTGRGWADACTSFAAALETACAKGAEGQPLPIYAAEGVYVIAETVALPKGFAIYGGFAGVGDDETPETRDVAAHPTVFTGDQTQDDVWAHAVPDEKQPKIAVTETSQRVLDGGRVSAPPAYTGAFDGYLAVKKGTNTAKLFTAAANVGGTLDGITFTGCSTVIAIAASASATAVSLNRLTFTAMTDAPCCIDVTQQAFLTLTVTDCDFRYVGTTAGCNTLGARLYCGGEMRNCRFESIVRAPANGSANSPAVLNDLGPAGCARCVDVVGCTFCRCSTACGVNNYYGGTCNIIGYGNAASCGTKFCDNVVSNCYTAANGATQHALVSFTIAVNGSQGANYGGTYANLRFENNLSLVKTEEGACYTMVGTAYGGTDVSARGVDAAGRYSLSDSVFRGNRIRAYGTTATSGTTAIAIAGSASTAPAMFTMVNCVFDSNVAEIAPDTHAGVNVVLCRGVANAQWPGENPTAPASMGLANCTFTGPFAEGVVDVAQVGAQTKDTTLVNCVFDIAEDAVYATPFSFSAPGCVRLYDCSAKNLVNWDAFGVFVAEGCSGDPVDLDGDYRHAIRLPDLRKSAYVCTNAAAVAGGNSANNYPVTYSFRPYGAAGSQPLCAAMTAATGDIGAIGDIYGEARAEANTRGAVQAMTPEAEDLANHVLLIRPRDRTLDAGGQPVDAYSTATVTPIAQMVRSGETAQPVRATADPTTRRVFCGWYRPDGSQYGLANPLEVGELTDDLVLEARFAERKGGIVIFY